MHTGSCSFRQDQCNSDSNLGHECCAPATSADVRLTSNLLYLLGQFLFVMEQLHHDSEPSTFASAVFGETHLWRTNCLSC